MHTVASSLSSSTVSPAGRLQFLKRHALHKNLLTTSGHYAFACERDPASVFRGLGLEKTQPGDIAGVE